MMSFRLGTGKDFNYLFKPVFHSCKPHRVLVRNKFLRHGGARDRFCYMDELMNATSVSLVKDARSVSLYPYNQSQIRQNVKYTK